MTFFNSFSWFLHRVRWLAELEGNGVIR